MTDAPTDDETKIDLTCPHCGIKFMEFRAQGRLGCPHDYEVFRVCSDISRQVFPLTLDTDNPKFRAGMERLRRLSDAMASAKAEAGLFASVRRLGLLAAIGASFAGLYLMRSQANEAPETVRLMPAW